jgi:hypothetical protein
VFLATLAFAALLLGAYFRNPLQPPDPATWKSGHLLTALYDPPTKPVETMVGQGDGQIFVTQAQDPLLRRTELIRGGTKQEAYRFQRPLVGWLGWVASGGQSQLAPWALIAISSLSVAALAALVAMACERSGRNPAWGLVVAILPGAFVDLTWVGPEALATGLMMGGLLCWTRGDRYKWAAVACFGLAGLTRESLLVVPAALCLLELVRRRPFRDVVTLATSALPYALWLLVLRVHLGALPGAVTEKRVSPLPFGGAFDQIQHWRPVDFVAAAVIVIPAFVVLVRRVDPILKVAIAANLVLAALLGPEVWRRYQDFGRVLLPLSVLTVLALAGVWFERVWTSHEAEVDAAADDDPAEDLALAGAR